MRFFGSGSSFFRRKRFRWPLIDQPKKKARQWLHSLARAHYEDCGAIASLSKARSPKALSRLLAVGGRALALQL